MSETILYVEDNPRNMRLVKKLLEHAGYSVLEAYDGESGIQMAVDHQPDLILMDVNLPDIDGLKATGRLKGMSITTEIPVIALTANAMLGDREKCIAAGCDDYIPKPVSKDLLMSTVASTLDNYRGTDKANEDTSSDVEAGSSEDDDDKDINKSSKQSVPTSENS